MAHLGVGKQGAGWCSFMWRMPKTDVWGDTQKAEHHGDSGQQSYICGAESL